MTTKEVIRLQEEHALPALKDLLSMVRQFKMTHAQLLERLRTGRYAEVKRRLPAYSRAMLNGYERATIDGWYRHDLEWRVRFDGPRGTIYSHDLPDGYSWDRASAGEHFWRGSDRTF